MSNRAPVAEVQESRALLGQARKQTGRTEDRDDLDEISADPVDDSKGRVNDLADVLSLKLRNNAPRQRESGEALYGGREAADDQVCVERRVLSNEVPDGLDVS